MNLLVKALEDIKILVSFYDCPEDVDHAKIRDIIKKALSLYSQSGNEKDLIIHGLEEGAESWKLEYDNCRSILRELTDLKEIKDSIDNMPPYQQGLNSVMIEDYKKRKPLAWERAKGFLKTYQHGYEYNSQSKEGEESKGERADIAYAAFKREYPEPIEGTFGSTWINGYCECLRDFESQSKENEGKQAGVWMRVNNKTGEGYPKENGRYYVHHESQRKSITAFSTKSGWQPNTPFSSDVIEWLDESIQSGERGEVERLKGENK